MSVPTDCKVVTVIQSRMASTRLPGKILKPIQGASLLERMVERVQMAELSGTVVVAITTDAVDDPLEKICAEKGLECFRGHPTDLLDRHYQCGLKYDADIVVKIPSDVPLIDPAVIDHVMQFYFDNADRYDFVSNLHPATYPDGNDVEIMPMPMLKLAHEEAKKEMEREHTTPFFWDNPSRFRIGNVEYHRDLSMTHRFTIDYQEDYDFIKAVYDELYPAKPNFSLDDILQLLQDKPEITQINAKFAGVNWYRNHLDELSTVDQNQTRKAEGEE